MVNILGLLARHYYNQFKSLQQATKLQNASMEQHKVLVIEPTELYQQIIKQQIITHNLEAVVCSNSRDALALLDGNEFELICCANELAEIKGIEVVKKLRQKAGGTVPILLITASDQKEIVNSAFSHGVTEVILRQSIIEIQYYLKELIAKDLLNESPIGNILLVEDSRPIAELIQTVLEEKSHTVQIVTSGEDALEKLVPEAGFDLVISDILLEGKMMGIALIREIRASQPPLDRLPILAISGLDNVDQRIEALKQGATDFIAKPVNFDELVVRVRNLIRSKRLYDQVVAQEQQLRTMVVTDPLTGLYNRHYLSDVGMKRVNEARRHSQHLSLVIVDLDHFKRINDTYGHLVGDKVLKSVGACLKQACRKEDFAVRVGGEEFILVLPHCHYQDAVKKAESIRQALLELKPEGIVTTASFGVAGLDPQEQSQDFSQVFQKADEAVYYSKENGRNQVTCAHSLETKSD